jgi:hypothetical protein
MYKKIALIILLLPSICIAKTIDVQLWSDSARISIGNHDEYTNEVNMEGSFFWNDKTKSKMFAYGITTLTSDYVEEDDKTKDKPQLFVNIGLKLFALDLGDSVTLDNTSTETAAGLSLGAEISQNILPDTRFPIRAIVRGYYAPSVVIFNNDFNNMYTLSADVEVLLQHNAIAYAGYHLISADLKNTSAQQVDNSMHVGFKILY